MKSLGASAGIAAILVGTMQPVLAGKEALNQYGVPVTAGVSQSQNQAVGYQGYTQGATAATPAYRAPSTYAPQAYYPPAQQTGNPQAAYYGAQPGYTANSGYYAPPAPAYYPPAVNNYYGQQVQPAYGQPPVQPAPRYAQPAPVQPSQALVAAARPAPVVSTVPQTPQGNSDWARAIGSRPAAIAQTPAFLQAQGAAAPAVNRQPVAQYQPPFTVVPGYNPYIGGANDQLAQARRRPGEGGGDVLDGAAPDDADARAREGIAPPSGLPRTFQDLMRYLDNREVDLVPIPDRWRLLEGLGIKGKWYDPYNNNVLKGDKPIFDDWFVLLNVISDTVYEPRAFPVPLGIATTKRRDRNDLFGDPDQVVFNQNLITNLTLIKGNTAYKPPDWEFRLTPVFNYNYVKVEELGILKRAPDRGTDRSDKHIGLQEAFVDYHIRNVSDRYDFDSIRVGIQPINADFRGFLFQDNQFAVRFFGTRNNNIFQYNLAWIRRLEKDTNSGLNDIGEDSREDDTFLANLYYQDFPVLGFVSQATVAYNRNREESFFFDDNDFIQRPASLGLERPREYDVTYLGYNGDGHFGRLNLSVSAYYALGEERGSTFSDEDSDIRAYFLAAEPSIDYSWVRLRGSALYASGDDDPFDDRSEGFSAIFENPQFAGADTSFWIRQNIPLIGGGGVTLSQRNGLIADLRSSKEHGQSNFVNPGIRLLGVGTDFDVLPQLRISTNFNRLDFNEPDVLETVRNQGEIDTGIGWDLSASAIYRPLMSQNVVFRLSYAGLIADDGFKALYQTDDEHFYTILANLTLAY